MPYRFWGLLDSCLAAGVLFRAFIVSLLIGIAAGVAPAMKAARLEPLEAMRTQ